MARVWPHWLKQTLPPTVVWLLLQHSADKTSINPGWGFILCAKKWTFWNMTQSYIVAWLTEKRVFSKDHQFNVLYQHSSKPVEFMCFLLKPTNRSPASTVHLINLFPFRSGRFALTIFGQNNPPSQGRTHRSQAALHGRLPRVSDHQIWVCVSPVRTS